MTRFETVMPYGGSLHRFEVPALLRRRLQRVITEGLLGDLDGRTATTVRADGETLAEIEVGTVVALEPELTLAPVLDSLGLPYVLAGDAVAQRTAFQAFKEGEEVALRI